MSKKLIIVGSGNAALCAGISALEKGATVKILEKANEYLAGGNTKYTAGAMRFVYNNGDELKPLLKDPNHPKLEKTNFGKYSKEKFSEDLLNFNDGKPLTIEQKTLINESYETMKWLASHDVKFEPIYQRQSFEKDGKFIFWGGLTLASKNEGVGLFDQELEAFKKLGGEIEYETPVTKLLREEGKIIGVKTKDNNFIADAVILASGGFEADKEMRSKYLGDHWGVAKVRGTPNNTGDGLKMAMDLGAAFNGQFSSCHATPMDLHMKDFGNLDLEPGERKKYRKICYFLGIMINADGKRFLDEGKNFRNYTYAQYGARVLEQPGHFAWQIFDEKVKHLLYDEYFFEDAHYVEANTLEELIKKMDGVNHTECLSTVKEFNKSCKSNRSFDPTILDGRKTIDLNIPKSNWALALDKPPYRAYPVTGGITFTYGGLKISKNGNVLDKNDQNIQGLYACGELVGGVFLNGYPGGSGLTSGAVFGRKAGSAAALGL